MLENLVEATFDIRTSHYELDYNKLHKEAKVPYIPWNGYFESLSYIKAVI